MPERKPTDEAFSTQNTGLTFAELAAILGDMESLQEKKVIDLARRLHPKLTSEDIKNPHDFPELNDLDWHYEDGLLTGIQAVKTAILSRQRDLEARATKSTP